jgi:hypothetical protein
MPSPGPPGPAGGVGSGCALVAPVPTVRVPDTTRLVPGGMVVVVAASGAAAISSSAPDNAMAPSALVVVTPTSWNSMYSPAAITPPTSGAMMNSQSWLNQGPPTTIAGPKLRAGFTDAPSIGIPMMLARASANPTIRPATGALAPLRVALSIMSTNAAVMITSIRKAPPADACRSDSEP